MKKIKFFSMLLIALFSFTLAGVINANASTEYVFTTDGNSTVEGNKFTLTATRSLISVDVSEMELDLTNMYVSVKYKWSASAEGFEMKMSGIDLNDAAVSDEGVAGVVAPNAAKGSPWNLTEHVISTSFNVATRLAATDNSFASNTYQFEVTTK